MRFASLRLALTFGLFALLALGACKADRGDACKEENDCSGSLLCCKAGSSSSSARGVCLPVCESPDAGPGLDSGTPTDSGVDAASEDGGADDASTDAATEDAGGEDAGAEDAGSDAGSDEDAGTDAGSEEDAGTDAGE